MLPRIGHPDDPRHHQDAQLTAAPAKGQAGVRADVAAVTRRTGGYPPHGAHSPIEAPGPISSATSIDAVQRVIQDTFVDLSVDRAQPARAVPLCCPLAAATGA